MKKLFCAFCICVILAIAELPVCAKEVDTSAAAFVLYCADNGKVLLSANEDRRLPMASTTKIMTTLLTLEAAAEENRVVEFTDEMTAEGSSMYLRKGEKVRLYDLAVGMMMQSGNDAANAAAIGIAGSIEGFSALMNEKAREIGMSDTHFVTPSGLDDEAHYSTAHDMALLMTYALNNDDFAYLTAQTSMEVHFVYPADRFVTYPNHNKLLRLYDACVGGKTGYTDQSGRCLVTAAKRDDITLVAVTLDDPDDWDDHIALYDYGFENYTAVQPAAEGCALPVMGGVGDSVSLYSDDSQLLVIPKDSGDHIKTQTFLPPFAYAPVEEGDIAGKIVYTLDGNVIGERPLYYSESVAYDNRKRGFFEWLKDLLRIRKTWHS